MAIIVGARLGRYEVRSLLGAGGMGEVYLAYDPRLERSVALKLLPPEVASDDERMRRFVQEARAASSLNHPNIITIYEIGEADATHFMAIEFVGGETLRASLKDAGMKTSEMLDVAVQVADALAAAHEAGIVHRDIKPENIMLRRRDRIVKVLDFGLAKLTESRADQTPADSQAPTRALIYTKPNAVMGTPQYMSPEQARGLPVDGRTDIWSLGCVLYEMATGRAPFGGATVSDCLVSVLEREPPRIAERAPATPAELEWIVAKALRKDAASRYQTMTDMLADLKSLKGRLEIAAEIERSAPPNINSHTVSVTADASDATTSEAQAKRTAAGVGVSGAMSGRRKLGAIAALSALVLAIAAAAYLYVPRSSRTINSVAVLPLINASNDTEAEYLSDGITESIINSLSQLQGLRVMSRNSVFRLKGRDVDAQAAGSELGVEAVLTGRFAQRGDNLSISVELISVADNSHLWGEQYNRPMADILSVQEEIARQITERLRLRLTGTDEQRLARRGTDNPEAYRLYLRGLYYWYKFPADDYHRSRDYFQQAIDLDPTYALGYAGLSAYYGFLTSNGGMSPQEGWLRGEAAARRALDLDPSLAGIHNFFAAQQLYYHRNWAAAEREFRRGIELNPNNAEIHQHYGLCLALMGRSEEGIAELRRALELDPLTLRINLNLGVAFYRLRRYGEAIEQYRRTLELEANYASAHEALGDAYAQQGNHAEAVAAWQRAMTLSRDNELAMILDRAYRERGFDEAVRAVARRRLERLNERRERGQYVPAANFARLYMELGDREQAFTWLERAVEEGIGLTLYLLIDPKSDSFRSDPRFQDLVRRVGLTQ